MAEKPDSTRKEKSILFHYIKSNTFKSFHVDGVHGGVTSRGNIQMEFFCERMPIPQITPYSITPEGRLGEEIRGKEVGKSGVIREVEVAAIISYDAAKSFAKWLNDKIEYIEKVENERKEEQSK